MRKLLIILSYVLYPLSCVLYAQQWHTSLDVWIPAEKVLPASGRVLIVNNIAKQPANFGHKTRQDDRFLEDAEIDLSAAIRPALFAAVEGLENLDIFTSVDLLDQAVTDVTFPKISQLNKITVQRLLAQYQADALMVCNLLLAYDQQESFLTDNDTYYAYLSAHETTRWTLFRKDAAPAQYIYQDSLYWEKEAATRTAALAGLPNRQVALEDLAIYTIERFFQKFSGHWQTVDRYLYSLEDEAFKNAMEQFTHQRWAAAAKAFESIYNDRASSTKAKAYAAANLAVVAEIQEDISTAIHWAELAGKTFGKLKTPDGYQQQVNLKYYQQQLEQRSAKNTFVQFKKTP